MQVRLAGRKGGGKIGSSIQRCSVGDSCDGEVVDGEVGGVAVLVKAVEFRGMVKAEDTNMGVICPRRAFKVMSPEE